jgi:hypothetical protein
VGGIEGGGSLFRSFVNMANKQNMQERKLADAGAVMRGICPLS